ncbi:hypothetical protein Tco_0840150 [Tanacetum coccineum]|uniref:Uncharacterized protein n=1 Tax=Tanacetum coccineum TaxID=301880 RepID=A0ABQ5AWR7_9ASTR
MDNTSAPIIEDWNSDDESEIDYTIGPSIEKIKSVKTVRETDAPKQNPRGNQRNWNNLMSGKLSTASATVNTGRSVNTANTKAVNTARPLNTAASKQIMNHPRSITNAFKRGYSQCSRPFNRHFANKNSITKTNVNTVMVLDKLNGSLQPIKDDSQHMTGNKCYLDEYEDYNGRLVSFGDGKGRISGKC